MIRIPRKLKYAKYFSLFRSARPVLVTAVAFFVCSAVTAAQSNLKPAANDVRGQAEVRSSAAYAELMLKRAEVQSDLEAFLVEYTEEFPKVVESRYALEVIEKERARLLSTRAADAGKLSVALGKLVVRKIELEVALWTLRKTFQDSHPDVKRAKKKADIYEAAVKEILG
jgi:hypothetical protein